MRAWTLGLIDQFDEYQPPTPFPLSSSCSSGVGRQGLILGVQFSQGSFHVLDRLFSGTAKNGVRSNCTEGKGGRGRGEVEECTSTPRASSLGTKFYQFALLYVCTGTSNLVPTQEVYMKLDP